MRIHRILCIDSKEMENCSISKLYFKQNVYILDSISLLTSSYFWLISVSFLSLLHSSSSVGTAKFPPEKFSKGKDSEEQQQQKDLSTEKKSDHKKIPLNSSDELFAVLRDKNFNAVGPELSKKAKTLSAIYDVSHQFTWFTSL